MPDSIRQPRADWFSEHHEYTACKSCETVIKINKTIDGLCPDCLAWDASIRRFCDGKATG